jgi:excisionase family DNA binding protein
MSGDKQYLRAADIAALTGASIRTVRRWIADEILPSTKLGGARLVSRTDLEGLLTPLMKETCDAIQDFDENSEH